MSPIYVYECKVCGSAVERIQGIDGESPVCECGAGMVKKPTRPAIIRVLGQGGYPVRSKRYKEGYSAEYLQDIGVEKVGMREKS